MAQKRCVDICIIDAKAGKHYIYRGCGAEWKKKGRNRFIQHLLECEVRHAPREHRNE